MVTLDDLIGIFKWSSIISGCLVIIAFFIWAAAETIITKTTQK